ncbi:MAG: hypothetical protein WB297_03380 [Actinomycetota bacterium]
MATSSDKKVSKALRVLDEADADLATLVVLSVKIADSQAELMRMMLEMQATQTSFSLQYLELQEGMQRQARQVTAISNIMKTKHDSVKNTITNIR